MVPWDDDPFGFGCLGFKATKNDTFVFGESSDRLSNVGVLIVLTRGASITNMHVGKST